MKQIERNKKGKIKGGASGNGFDVRGQPSPEAKSAGWKKKRDIQSWIDTYERLSIKKFKELGKELRGRKTANRYEMAQLIAYKYVARCYEDVKVTFDRLDRTRGKAIQKVEKDITSKGESLNFRIVDGATTD